MKRKANLSDAKRALRLFASEYAPRSVRHANARAWLKSVQQLGGRWLLAQPMTAAEQKK